jgi:hypothetical protein
MLVSCVKSYPEKATISPAHTMPPNYWTRAQKIVSESLKNTLTLPHQVIVLFPPKMLAKILAMNAPIDPLAGWAIDGGFGRAGIAGFETDGTLGGVIITPANVMVGSSAIIAMSRPAQPN